MNIHEYQGKSILQSFGVAIQRGKVADTPEAAHEAAVALAEETSTEWFVVKAQIHAGGRGKGVVTETGSCLLYTSPSPRDRQKSRMPSSA